MAGAGAAAYIGARGSRTVALTRCQATQEDDAQMLSNANFAFTTAQSNREEGIVVSTNISRALADGLKGSTGKKQATPGRQFINSVPFVSFIYVVILLNALQMGLQVDWDYGGWLTLWSVLEHIFTAVFAVEMIIKLYVLEKAYFLEAPTNTWNILDFFIAWSSIIGSWIIPAVTGGDGPKFLRVFQFFRLLRMIKILKMRKDLLALIDGIKNSLKSMLWVSVLLFIIHYCVGIFFAQVIGGHDLEETYAEVDFDNQDSFGSLWRAMMTLFSICVVDNWSDVVMPVAQVQPYLIPVFICFLVMTSFGLLNALIGIIVERTTAAIAEIHEQENNQARQAKLEKVKALVQICGDIDTSGDGTISPAELEAASKNPRFQEIMEEIDLPPGFKGPDLHLMLDVDGGGDLAPEEFINGMYQLIFCNEFQRECLTKHSISQIKHEMWKATKGLEQQIWAIRRDLAAMRGVELPEDPPSDSGGGGGGGGTASKGLRPVVPGKTKASLLVPHAVKPQNAPLAVPATSYGRSSFSKKAVSKEDKEGNDGERQAENQSEGDTTPLIGGSVEVPSAPSPQAESRDYDAEQILLNQETLSAALSALAQERVSSDDGVLIERVRERMSQVETALRNLEQSTLNKEAGGASALGGQDYPAESPGSKKKMKPQGRSVKSSVRVKKRNESSNPDNPAASDAAPDDDDDQRPVSQMESLVVDLKGEGNN